MNYDIPGWDLIRTEGNSIFIRVKDRKKDAVDDKIVKELAEFEAKRDLEHTLVLSMLRQGQFKCASQMYNSLDLAYRPSNILEDINFARFRRHGLLSTLAKTETISSLEVVWSDIFDGRETIDLDQLTLTNTIMTDILKLNHRGRHELRYALMDTKEYLLVDY